MGGGIAGLTFAREVSRRGKSVVLLEKREQLGGLARTFVFGEYRFDIGGHRLVSPWPNVIDWVRQLMDDDLLEVGRVSHILLNGHYIHYPLKLPDALLAFNPFKAAQVLASYLTASLRDQVDDPNASFEDWVVSRFGRSLYDIYFRPYTEKVWGVNCQELAADHAVQRIRIPSLTAAVKGSLLRHTAPRETLVSRFHYPPLGFGMLTEQLARQAEATGLATIHVNSAISRLEHDSKTGVWEIHYLQEGQEHCVTGRQVVSTIPVQVLLTLLAGADRSIVSLADGLDYRGVICVCLAIDGPRLSEDTWTYFPAPGLIFGRTHEPLNWSPRMAPQSKTSLVAEIFCTTGDSLWQMPDGELIDRTVADLERLNWLTRNRVQNAWLLRESHAYPVYRLGYKDKMQRIHNHLAKWPTLHLTGRTGSFQYLNADAVIKQSLELVENLAGT